MKTKLTGKQKKLLLDWTDKNPNLKVYSDLSTDQKKELESGKYNAKFIEDVDRYMGKLFFIVKQYKK